jgi:hypothetical protein
MLGVSFGVAGLAACRRSRPVSGRISIEGLPGVTHRCGWHPAPALGTVQTCRAWTARKRKLRLLLRLRRPVGHRKGISHPHQRLHPAERHRRRLPGAGRLPGQRGGGHLPARPRQLRRVPDPDHRRWERVGRAKRPGAAPASSQPGPLVFLPCRRQVFRLHRHCPLRRVHVPGAGSLWKVR